MTQGTIHVVFAEENNLFRLMEIALRRGPTPRGETVLRYFFGDDIAAPLARLTAMADRLGLPAAIDATVCVDAASLDGSLNQADFVVLEDAAMPAARLQACAGRTRLVQKFGRLTDPIDMVAAARLGVPVANLNRISTLSCADHVTALILAMARNLLPAHRAVADRRNPALAPAFVQDPPRNKFNWAGIGGFRILPHSTVGFFGLGEIAGLVAQRMRAMGTRVLYHKRTPLNAEAERGYGGVTYVSRDDLLAESDFIVLQVPYGAETEKFANRAFFAKMKRGACLINAARGGLVDEQALYDSLRTGHLGGAALDVYRYEPVPPDCPLLTLDNVLWSPHIAGGEPDYMIMEAEAVLANIAKVLRGEAPDGLVSSRA